MKLDKALCERAGGQWIDGKCQGAVCETCKQRGDWRGLSRSHIIPKSRGGRDTLENVLIECYPDHERYEKHPERRPECQMAQAKIAAAQANYVLPATAK